ncbi:hypothetical protein AVEN_131290-1 [Araneus ventricosus]|uniref:Uncharacterized protein n=1 Tax=Araneus ventricosus TaxID=182803 RepID=A0A4Y2HF51_ARAVE|nr:hypothetical protein AVEN_131290-1 [Araneus ventricosus]
MRFYRRDEHLLRWKANVKRGDRDPRRTSGRRNRMSDPPITKRYQDLKIGCEGKEKLKTQTIEGSATSSFVIVGLSTSVDKGVVVCCVFNFNGGCLGVFTAGSFEVWFLFHILNRNWKIFTWYVRSVSWSKLC